MDEVDAPVLFVLELDMSARASRSKTHLASLAAWLLLYLPTLTIGGINEYYGLNRGASLFIPMLERILLVIVRTLPDNLLVVGLAAAIPPAILYVLLDRQFSLSEVRRSPLVQR